MRQSRRVLAAVLAIATGSLFSVAQASSDANTPVPAPEYTWLKAEPAPVEPAPAASDQAPQAKIQEEQPAPAAPPPTEVAREVPVLALAPAPVRSPTPAKRVQDNNWYADVGLGIAFSGVSEGDFESELAASGYNAMILDLDSEASQAFVRVGYRFNALLSAELGLDWSDDFSFRLNSDTDDPDGLVAKAADVLPSTGTGLTLALAAQRRWDDWSLQGRIGAYVSVASDLEVGLQGQDYEVDQKSESILLGLGGSYHFSPEWQLGLEGQYFDRNTDLLQLRLFLRRYW